jgi:hypothetical protein
LRGPVDRLVDVEEEARNEVVNAQLAQFPHDACNVSLPAVGRTILTTAEALRAGKGRQMRLTARWILKAGELDNNQFGDLPVAIAVQHRTARSLGSFRFLVGNPAFKDAVAALVHYEYET